MNDKFYENALKNGDIIQKNGWDNRHHAQERYQECGRLLNELQLPFTKVFDYGCGTANLHQYVVNYDYVGIEEMQEMYDAALLHNPEVEVYHSSLENFTTTVYDKASIGVSLGIYMVTGEKGTRQQVHETVIEHCKLLCERHRYGYMFNSKHNAVDWMDDHMVHFNLAYIMHKLNEEGLRVTLHLWKNYEFFLYCRKW